MESNRGGHQEEGSDTISDRFKKTAHSFSNKKSVHDVVSKISGSRKSSQDTTGNRPYVRLENTYRMKPNDGQRFLSFKLKPKIQQLIDDKMKHVEANHPTNYDGWFFSGLSRELADSIRRETKNYGLPRYKVVSHVVVGQNTGQDIRIASRCLWNLELDDALTVNYESKMFYVTATVYVLYAE